MNKRAKARLDIQEGEGTVGSGNSDCVSDKALLPLGLAFDAKDEHVAWVEGGVTRPRGFKAAGVQAGFLKGGDRPDFALIAADEPCACAGVFTRNRFAAAPVAVSRDHLNRSGSRARAVIVNAGIANAATGDRGVETARAACALAASALGCAPEEVLIAETGVIGVHVPMQPFEEGIPAACAALSRSGGAHAARAIMTTDTRPKECAVTFSGADVGLGDRVFSIGAMAKGSGMIMPDMATMIAIITTDAPVAACALASALHAAVDASFNRVTVDSDTSTNDTCLIMAGGARGANDESIVEGTGAFERFKTALTCVCTKLARAIAADGEGASRLVTVRVAGALDDADADAAARTVANSPLVKTAIFGHDANWGRIAAALGRSGACFEQEHVSIDIMGMPVCRQGLTVAFDEAEALRRFELPEIEIDVDLGAGHGTAMVWTCDLTHGYITINGDYRT